MTGTCVGVSGERSKRMSKSSGLRLLAGWSGLCLVWGCQSASKLPATAAQATNPMIAESLAQSSRVSLSPETKEPADILLTSASATDDAVIPPTPPVHGVQPIPESPLNLAGAAETGLTLQQFEQIAIQNNPAISSASASASKAAGFREQVGAYPNPNVGYGGQQLADKGTDQHIAYVEQEFVTAHKLQLNQRVLDQEVQAQLWEVEAQRFRVLTDVRQRFYEALAAQQRYDIALDFEEVAREGVRIAELRKEALEGSLPEVLQAEIQLNEVELIRQRAEIAYQAAWQQLIAVAGVPHLAPVRLDGELRVSAEPKDWNSTYQELVASNPALRAARARVTRSIANLSRQEVQAIPNLQTITSAGYDYGTDSGMIQIQAGIALPVFNRNQGNITAAQAEYCRSVQEVRRLELALQSRLATASRQYDSSAITVTRYEEKILPKARQTLELSEKAYAAGEFGFLQVLVARRTYFDSNLEYNQALIELADAKWLIDGLLLDGGLNDVTDTQMDDGLRGQTLSGQ